MREILFRGKDIESGFWRRGYFVKEEDPYNGDRYIIMWEADICREFPIMRKAKVIPETVSQFTGFYDMDGNMIFEGDILNFPG